MVRKKTKSAKPKAPDKPGRLIKDWNGEEVHEESVAIAMTDAVLRRVADEIKDISGKCEAALAEVKKAKEALAPLERRRKQLIEAVARGTLAEDRTVFKFAVDDGGTVSLYDAETHELLQTRPIEYYERQEEAFAGDEESGDDE